MKDLSYEVDVLYVDKHERLLQADSIIFDELDQTRLKCLGNFAIFL